MSVDLTNAPRKLYLHRSQRVKSTEIFSGEKKWALTALYSGEVELIDYDKRMKVKKIEVAQNQPVRCARIIERKQWIVTASDDKDLRVFNYNTMEKVKHIQEAHNDYIRSLDVHHSRPIMISSSDDFDIKVWDFERNWACLAIMHGHTHYVMQVKFSPKSQDLFASASLDEHIRIWKLPASVTMGGIGSSGSSYSANNAYNTSSIYSLKGHTKGVNCIDYYQDGDKPYLVSGSDDSTVRIWDYQTKACIQVLDGHTGNVCAVLFYPGLPYVITGSEDGRVLIYKTNTWQHLQTLNYGVGRCWHISSRADKKLLAIGYDSGCVFVQLGSLLPVCSMDASAGKLIITRGDEVVVLNIKGAINSLLKEKSEQQNDETNALLQPSAQQNGGESDEVHLEGESLLCQSKSLGVTEKLPSALMHNMNGRMFTIVGEGEYVIYSSVKMRTKCFGACYGFVWDAGCGSGAAPTKLASQRFAVIANARDYQNEGGDIIVNRSGTGDNRPVKSCLVIRTVAQQKSGPRPIMVPLTFNAEYIYGGPLIAIKGPGFVNFYTWDTGHFVYSIDVDIGFTEQNQTEFSGLGGRILWNDTGDLLAIATASAIYTLEYDHSLYETAKEEGRLQKVTNPETGIQDCMKIVAEVPEFLVSGLWVADCLVYTSGKDRLNYLVGSMIQTISHLPRKGLRLLAYLQPHILVLIDVAKQLVVYSISKDVLLYQTLVLRGDEDGANEVFERLPLDRANDIAKFLWTQGYEEVAMDTATDNELIFEYAMKLENLEKALEVVQESAKKEESKTLANRSRSKGSSSKDYVLDLKWKQVGDLALQRCEFDIAETCFQAAGDVAALLMLYSSTGNQSGIEGLVKLAGDVGKFNVQFSCLFLLKRVSESLDLLLSLKRIPEAAFFARAYVPSRLSEVMGLWRKELAKTSTQRAADSLASPEEDAEFFPDFEKALRVEAFVEQFRQEAPVVPANIYPVLRNRQHGSQADAGDGEAPQAPTPPTHGAHDLMKIIAECDGNPEKEKEKINFFFGADFAVTSSSGTHQSMTSFGVTPQTEIETQKPAEEIFMQEDGEDQQEANVNLLDNQEGNTIADEDQEFALEQEEQVDQQTWGEGETQEVTNHTETPNDNLELETNQDQGGFDDKDGFGNEDFVEEGQDDMAEVHQDTSDQNQNENEDGGDELDWGLEKEDGGMDDQGAAEGNEDDDPFGDEEDDEDWGEEE